LPLLGLAYYILDTDTQSLAVAVNLNCLDVNQVGKPLLESVLHQGLRTQGNLVAVGHDSERHQSATQVWAIGSLSGLGKQQLLNKLANVLRIISRPNSALRIDA
jgi:hypothetical protein